MIYNWPVVPLSEGQLLDVNPNDILANGHFRTCNSYRGGGGYDQFPELASLFLHRKPKFYADQFIVQLQACNLDCPYCYVTRAGVWGDPVKYTSKQLVEEFNKSDVNVFHLMGGAPALKLGRWPELIEELEKNGKKGWVFHSDLMLSEREYTKELLKGAYSRSALYAVNIKGVSPEIFLENTRKPLNQIMLLNNLKTLYESDIYFYFTFTDLTSMEIDLFWALCEPMFTRFSLRFHQRHSFSIDLIEYEAGKHVDDVNWGKQK